MFRDGARLGVREGPRRLTGNITFPYSATRSFDLSIRSAHFSTRRMTKPSHADFQDLLGPVLDSAFGMAMGYTGGREADAEDLVQEAALKAFRGFGSFEPGTNFKAWFFRILMNSAVSRFRKTSRRPVEVELEDASGGPLLMEAAERGLDVGGSDPARSFIQRIRLQSIHEAIADLPDEFRQVCVLYFLEEFTYPEIAEVLEIPVGTVRSRLHRARKALQRRLMDMAVEDGVVTPPEATGSGDATPGNRNGGIEV